MVISQPLEPALVHAIGALGPERRRLSRAATIAIAGSLAAHAVVGLYLYKVRYGAPAVLETSPPTTATFVQEVRVKPAPPKPAPAVKRTLVIHESNAPMTTSTPTLPIAPTKLTVQPANFAIAPLPPLSSQTSAAGKPVITEPDWVSLPGPKEFSRFYPQAALDHDASGTVRLACRVSADGAVHYCQATAETPKGLGFAAAAQKLVPYFKMRPLTRDGTPVDGGSITIPVRFNLG